MFVLEGFDKNSRTFPSTYPHDLITTYFDKQSFELKFSHCV